MSIFSSVYRERKTLHDPISLIFVGVCVCGIFQLELLRRALLGCMGGKAGMRAPPLRAGPEREGFCKGVPEAVVYTMVKGGKGLVRYKRP